MKFLTHRLFITLLLSILTRVNLSGQNVTLDSLKLAIVNAPNDSVKVVTLRELSRLFRSYNKDSSILYANQGIALAKKSGFKQGEIKGLYNLGLTYGMAGDYLEAIQVLNRCETKAIEQDDYNRVRHVYNAMGIIHKRIGDYPTSLRYYQKCLILVDSLDLKGGPSSIYSNLGVLYDLMGDQEKAVESYNNALSTYQGEDKTSVEQTVLANLAVIDFNKKDYQAALDKFLKSLSLQDKDEKIELCNTYSNIGNCYVLLNKYDQGEEYLKKALTLATNLSLQRDKAIVYHNLAKLEQKRGNLNQAIQFSKKNIAALKNSRNLKQVKEAHLQAFEVYKDAGVLRDAMNHLTAAMSYKDSILNETKVRELQNLQIKHEVYVKDQEISTQELELKLLNANLRLGEKRQLYLLAITLMLLFSASMLYFRYSTKRKSNQLLAEKNELISKQNEEIEIMNKELEKRMLRAQMNPHFIFNSLNSIQHFITNKDEQSALTYLSKFSKLLRQILESSINANLILHQEIELLKIYVELESLRFDESFKYDFKIDNSLDLYQHEVPMLLVQPYIENAILHGLMPKPGKKQLTIRFDDLEKYVRITIEDNGVGYSAPKEVSRPSRGSAVTAQRIDALKQFTDQKLLTIDSSDSGTKVTILIHKEE